MEVNYNVIYVTKNDKKIEEENLKDITSYFSRGRNKCSFK